MGIRDEGVRRMSMLSQQSLMMASGTSGPGAYALAVLAKSPLAYWRLNETSGTSAADLSGNGHTGTYAGTITLGSASLLPGGNGLSITKTGTGNVQFTGLSSTDRPFTIQAWVKRSSAPASTQVIFSTGAAGGIQLGLDSTGKLVCGASGNFNLAQGTAVLTVGVAYLVTFTCDASGNYEYYLNGTLDKSASGAGSFNGNVNGVIGVYPVAAQFPFLGQIQDVALFGTHFTSTDVSTIYAAGSLP